MPNRNTTRVSWRTTEMRSLIILMICTSIKWIFLSWRSWWGSCRRSTWTWWVGPGRRSRPAWRRRVFLRRDRMRRWFFPRAWTRSWSIRRWWLRLLPVTTSWARPRSSSLWGSGSGAIASSSWRSWSRSGSMPSRRSGSWPRSSSRGVRSETS